VVHRNAPLTETGRLRLARCIVDDGWPIARAAERFQVSRPTATRWAQRYRQLGVEGMAGAVNVAATRVTTEAQGSVYPGLLSSVLPALTLRSSEQQRQQLIDHGLMALSVAHLGDHRARRLPDRLVPTAIPILMGEGMMLTAETH
jgi:transposase-like protein